MPAKWPAGRLLHPMRGDQSAVVCALRRATLVPLAATVKGFDDGIGCRYVLNVVQQPAAIEGFEAGRRQTAQAKWSPL
jgi:hypothetical protein